MMHRDEHNEALVQNLHGEVANPPRQQEVELSAATEHEPEHIPEAPRDEWEHNEHIQWEQATARPFRSPPPLPPLPTGRDRGNDVVKESEFATSSTEPLLLVELVILFLLVVLPGVALMVMMVMVEGFGLWALIVLIVFLFVRVGVRRFNKRGY
jgi:hypothetical protein